MTSTAVQPALQPASKKLQFASWPFFDFEEIEAASAVLRSGKVNYWTGEEGRQFEVEFAEFCGARHAVCLANGTLALELALQAMGIGARRRSYYYFTDIYCFGELRSYARGASGMRRRRSK